MRTLILSTVFAIAPVFVAQTVTAAERSVEDIMADISSASASVAPVAAVSAPEDAVVPEPVASGESEAVLPAPQQASTRKNVAAIPSGTAEEETAIDQVRQSWNGTVLRDYALSTEAKRALNLLSAETVTDLRESFPEVSFVTEGSSALFRPQLRRLFVVNTPEQVRKLETVLASLDSTSTEGFDQVEIESRFVEFEEGALEELGFNWSNIEGSSSWNWSVQDGSSLFSDSLRTLPYSQTGALGLGEAVATGDWTASRLEDRFNGGLSGTQTGTLSLSGSINSADVDLLIRSLDQTAGVDVLSAPRIVTVSGKKAVIQVGQRHYYPKLYEEGVSEGTVLHVRYEGFAEKLLGVEMAVTPKIKGDEISLSMNPKITDLVGYEKYELAPADSSYTFYQYRVGMQFEHDPVVAHLPVFKEREIKTEVMVQDGSTVAMGGLISEKTESFQDRVPVLGSIPLVGRLFRSEGERNVKRNLMIFVTAKKVQPNGTVIPERTFE